VRYATLMSGLRSTFFFFLISIGETSLICPLMILFAGVGPHFSQAVRHSSTLLEIRVGRRENERLRERTMSETTRGNMFSENSDMTCEAMAL
jgi:hypothetical protein